MTFDIYQVITDKILVSLEQGVTPWLKPWTNSNTVNTATLFPYNGFTGKNYSGVNVLLLSCNNYASNDYYTFKQVTELKGNVKKGEKSHIVVYWHILEKTDTNGNIDKIPFLKYYNVFNREQCENLPESKVKQVTVNHVALDALPEKLGVKLAHGGNKAFYSPANDSITMPLHESFTDTKYYDATLLHELTHSTGHETRCKRDFKNRFGSDAYAFEELIAELGSAFLGASLGVTPVLQHNASYIASWLTVLKNDKKAILKASSEAQKACNYVLSMLETDITMEKEAA